MWITIQDRLVNLDLVREISTSELDASKISGHEKEGIKYLVELHYDGNGAHGGTKAFYFATEKERNDEYGRIARIVKDKKEDILEEKEELENENYDLHKENYELGEENRRLKEQLEKHTGREI